MLKTSLCIFITSFIGSIGISFIFSPPFSILSWVNTLFVVSILLLVIGCALFVIQGGFFNRFIENFKTFVKSMNKANQIGDEIERKDRDTINQPIKLAISYPLMLVGLVLFLISIIISINL